jgi:fatty acid desaturase
VQDLFAPKPWVYWCDFLASLGAGAVAFHFTTRAESWALSGVLFVTSCLAYYRAALFIHELTHLKKGTFQAFRFVWNMLCGIPFLMPSFLYYTHVAHHARKHYGTPEDGEYLPLGVRPVRDTILYLMQPFVIPVLAAARFLLLTPVAWLSPKSRRWIAQRASSMVMDPSYVRPIPTPRELGAWRFQEFACFCYALAAAVLFASGQLPLALLLQGYLTALAIIMLNAIRTMGAHRFVHDGSRDLTFVEQLLDSVNFPNRPILTGLWAPVGLRFHALHHLFPSMPYHSLAAAHRRLMDQLPANSPYRKTVSPGLTFTLRELWRGARAAGEVRRRARVDSPSSVPAANEPAAKRTRRARNLSA